MLPEWFLIALIAPVIWCLSNLLDQFVSRAFENSTIACLAFVGITVTPFILIIPLFVDVARISISEAINIMIGGALFMAAIYPYLLALKQEDAATAIPLFQLTPVFVYLLGLVFLGEVLSTNKLVGGVIITVAAVAISWNFESKRINGKVFGLMALSSLIFGTYTIWMRSLASSDTSLAVKVFWLSFAWFIIGLTILAVSTAAQKQIRSVVKKYKASILLFGLAQEGGDVIAQAAVISALAIAPTAVEVQLVGGLQAVIIIAFAAIIGWLLPQHYPPIKADRYLLYKFGCSAVMLFGLYILTN